MEVKGLKMATKTTKNETTLKFYKLHPNAKDPLYATEGSACFDIHACFDGVEKYEICSRYSKQSNCKTF